MAETIAIIGLAALAITGWVKVARLRRKVCELTYGKYWRLEEYDRLWDRHRKAQRAYAAIVHDIGPDRAARIIAEAENARVTANAEAPNDPA